MKDDRCMDSRNILRWLSCWAGGCLLALGSLPVRADGDAFARRLDEAALAWNRGDLPAALQSYLAAEQAGSNDASALCVVVRKYCDLSYLTNSARVQKDLVRRGLACSLRAVALDSNNATAHACVAVCYARSCAFTDLKTELTYSRQFKGEAEKAIALDPRQDIAYYLLGRWNLAIANLGFFSRTLVQAVYGRLPKASNQAAIANFKIAAALAPARIIHHAGLAMSYEAEGEKALAVAEWRKCGELKPADPADRDAQREAMIKLKALGF